VGTGGAGELQKAWDAARNVGHMFWPSCLPTEQFQYAHSYLNCSTRGDLINMEDWL
jgi:hypothetical protein